MYSHLSVTQASYPWNAVETKALAEAIGAHLWQLEQETAGNADASATAAVTENWKNGIRLLTVARDNLDRTPDYIAEVCLA